MSYRVEVDELELVEAVARHGSVGAAARELHLAQPSASRRLSALERHLGVVLFDRDTTGARPTAAGAELARLAARLLEEIDQLPEDVLRAQDAPRLTVGTIQALSPMVATALAIELPEVLVDVDVDHGPVLLQRLVRGGLDAVIVTIAQQTAVPRGLRRTSIGSTPVVLVVPRGAPEPAAGARPFAGRRVWYSTIDLAGDVVHRRLTRLGARPAPGPTVEAALRLARHHGEPAIVPGIAARWYAAPGDRIGESPVRESVDLSLVSRPPTPPMLVAALPAIRRRLLGPDSQRDGD